MEKLIDSRMIPVVDICGVTWVCSFSMYKMQQERVQALLKTYEYINAHPDELVRRIMPNNWLKLHGYRMRRRVR